MKQVNFPEANSKDNNNQPIAIVEYTGDGRKSLHSIVKFVFNKDEARFIAKNRHIWMVQKIGQNNPLFAFQHPFSGNAPFKLIDFNMFITHKLWWQEHEFLLLLSRDYNNTKAKVRWFSITMDGDWIKSGNLPDSLQKDGKGWLKRVMIEMIEEYERMMSESEKA